MSSTSVSVKKRERTQNWVPEEKRALFSLIKTHINAIENKKIDTSATALKSLAWRQIYNNFKGKFSTERDITRMREQWRRMKALARVEIIAFAEKVRTVGLEEAAKNRPTDLSVDVWRLLQFQTKNECESTSEESQEADSITNLQEILDNLGSRPLENSIDSEKQSTDEFNDDNPSSRRNSSPFTSSPLLGKSRGVRLMEDEPINLTDQKRMRMSSFVEDDDEFTLVQNDLLDSTVEEERIVKLKILNLELERVELQKQTAVNELRTSEIRKQLAENQAMEYFSQARMSGERGSGAGRGGGGGGAIRDAGGSFGKMEAAHEDQYFYNLQKEQLKNLKDGLHDEISFHEEQIKRHQEAINRHKERIEKMDHE